MPAENPQTADDDALEVAVTHAIAACDGDLRAAIRALIVANNFMTEENASLRAELELTWQQVSPGFSRGKRTRRMRTADPG